MKTFFSNANITSMTSGLFSMLLVWMLFQAGKPRVHKKAPRYKNFVHLKLFALLPRLSGRTDKSAERT